jgi:hypothetical protein
MALQEKNDLRRLQKLAFRRAEKSGDVAKSFHRLPSKIRQHPDYALLTHVYAWLFVPYSLWPIDVDGLLRFMMEKVKAGKRFDEKIRFVVQLLGDVPELKVPAKVIEHEFMVQKGQYEPMVKSLHKYEEFANDLAENPQLQEEWRAIRNAFNLKKLKKVNRTGVVQRRMVQERNFRPNWTFKWRKEAERFDIVFDAFCCRWDLYGMENDKPLLLKFSMNMTPYGTMLMVPRYWSLDGHRDLRWDVIAEFHRARGVLRQGPKMSMNRTAMRQETRNASDLWNQAKGLGMKGSRRDQWVMNRMGWLPHTDPSRLRTVLKRRKAKWFNP